LYYVYSLSPTNPFFYSSVLRLGTLRLHVNSNNNLKQKTMAKIVFLNQYPKSEGINPTTGKPNPSSLMYRYGVTGSAEEVAAYAENTQSQPDEETGMPTWHRKTFYGAEREVTISEDGQNVNLLPTVTELMEAQLKGMPDGPVKEQLAGKIADERLAEMMDNIKVLQGSAKKASDVADVRKL
jgi:hypothetical protein